MKTIFDNHTKLECMKGDKSNRCELYLPQKIASREGVPQGPKMLKIDYSGGMGGGGWRFLYPWLYGPGFLDCWAIGPQVKNSKMITDTLRK